MTQFTAQFCNALKFINLTKVTNMCNCRLADVIVILEWEAFFLLFFLISLSKGYRHPDGIYSPEGVYGTLIPPFADTTQKALKQILYARPRNRQVTHFVTVDNDARWDHRTLGSESVIRAPRRSEVQVKVVYSGINLMDLK